jgi:hypothetical protein
MSLDGLRAWIGEVERQLGMRTRVFLVLVAIAIGGAGTAVYLAAEAQNDQVSKDDLQAVSEELEGRIGSEGATTDLTQIETELRALKAEIAGLEDEGGGAKKGSSTGPTGGAGADTANPDNKIKELQELAKKAEEDGK